MYPARAPVPDEDTSRLCTPMKNVTGKFSFSLYGERFYTSQFVGVFRDRGSIM